MSVRLWRHRPFSQYQLSTNVVLFSVVSRNMTYWDSCHSETIRLEPISELCRASHRRLHVPLEITKGGLQMRKCFLQETLGLILTSWGKMQYCGQVGVNIWKKEDQNTSILPHTVWPELPYDDDFCKNSLSTKIDICCEQWFFQKMAQKCLGVAGGHPDIFRVISDPF